MDRWGCGRSSEGGVGVAGAAKSILTQIYICCKTCFWGRRDGHGEAAVSFKGPLCGIDSSGENRQDRRQPDGSQQGSRGKARAEPLRAPCACGTDVLRGHARVRGLLGVVKMNWVVCFDVEIPWID